MDIKIITGLSGAGKSTVMRKLEDMDYYCIDNLPPQLLEQFVQLCESKKSTIDKLAIVIDIRGLLFFEEFKELFKKFVTTLDSCSIIYLEADNDVLVKRYKETRRVHPLTKNMSIVEGIKKEIDLTYFLKRMADHVIDTSHLKTRDLEKILTDIFTDNQTSRGINVNIMSFGYKYGLPIHADLVFDVRFIDNPFYIDELRVLTGEDKKVVEYIMSQNKAKVFLEKLNDMLDYLFTEYTNEGRSRVVVAIGCTGGKHRSVAIARNIYDSFSDKDYNLIINHRDKDK